LIFSDQTGLVVLSGIDQPIPVVHVADTLDDNLTVTTTDIMRLSVRNGGSLLSEAVPVNLALSDAPVNESIVYSLCTTAGKIDVVVISTTDIGVTGDEEVLVRIVLQDGSDSVQNLLRERSKDILVEIEGHVVKHDGQELVRALDFNCIVDFLDNLDWLLDVRHDRSREDGAETVEVSTSEIDAETCGDGWHESEDVILADPRRYLEDFVTDAEDAEVKAEAEPVADAEVVEDTRSNTPLVIDLVIAFTILVGRILKTYPSCSDIRNNIPETGLLVATKSIGDVPKQVGVDVLEELEVSITIVNQGRVSRLEVERVVQTVETEPETYCRSEPLTDVEVDCRTAEAELGLL
jgi:hypothetical protein